MKIYIIFIFRDLLWIQELVGGKIFLMFCGYETKLSRKHRIGTATTDSSSIYEIISFSELNNFFCDVLHVFRIRDKFLGAFAVKGLIC